MARVLFNRSFLGLLSASCAAAALGPASAFAQEGAVQTLDPILLRSEAAAGGATLRIERDPLTTPRATTTVDASVVQAQGAESIEEAIAYAPGVTAEPWGLDERYDNFAIRGFPSHQQGIYRDGLRQRTISFFGPRIETFTLDEIDVLRGPTADLFGANDPGGLVNVRSKRPEFTFGGTAYGRATNHGGVEFGVDVTGPISDTVAGRAILVVNEQGTRYDGVTGQRIHFSPSLTFEPTDSTRLTIYGQYQEDEIPDTYVLVPQYGSQLPGALEVGQDLYTGDRSRDGIASQQNFIGYEFEHDFADVTLYSRARYFEGDWRNRTAYPVLFANSSYLLGSPSGLPSEIDAAILGDFNVDEDMTEVSFDLGITGDQALGNMDLRYAIGVDYYRSELEGSNGTTVSDILFLANGFTTPAGVTLGIGTTAERAFKQTGVYASLQGQSGPLTLDFGLRHDWIESKLDTVTNLLGTPVPTKTEVSEGFTSANLGLSYEMSPGLVAYGSASRSFAPAPLGTTKTGAPLKLETARAFELGMRYDGGPLQLGVSAFDITIENAAYPDASNPLISTQYRQAGEIRSRGVELAGAYVSESGFGIRGAYTYTDAEVTKDPINAGNRIARIPEHMGNLWLTYDKSTDMGDLSFGLGARYVGERFSDTANKYKVDAVTLVDASARWQQDDLSVTLAARNLADRGYVAYCRGSDIPAGLGYDALLPTGNACTFGPGREVSLTVSTEF